MHFLFVLQLVCGALLAPLKSQKRKYASGKCVPALWFYLILITFGLGAPLAPFWGAGEDPNLGTPVHVDNAKNTIDPR